jgi:hypothetical protein
MSDALLPFARTNFDVMSARKRRSPYQELRGVTPSSRGIILSSKIEISSVVGHRAVDMIKGLLESPRVFGRDVKMLVIQVCESSKIHFEGRHQGNRSTKMELLEWSKEN